MLVRQGPSPQPSWLPLQRRLRLLQRRLHSTKEAGCWRLDEGSDGDMARSTAAATACSFASCAALIMRAARHRPAAQEKGSTKARERGETSAASTRRTACKHAAREQAASETLHFCDVSFGDKFFACSSFPV